MDYLSLCCIVKDEDPLYLKEWVNFHAHIGVERFYIYDNRSQIPVNKTLVEDIESGRVVVIDTPGTTMQYSAFVHCLEFFGKNSRWIGFIDNDELIVPRTTNDLRQYLTDFEPYGGLAVNWLVFGSSGHIEKPDSTQVESYTMRTASTYSMNRHIKSIVQPEFTVLPRSPHHFSYCKQRYCVNEKYEPVKKPKTGASVETIQINHYFCRSQAHYREKISRGRADVINVNNRSMKQFSDIDQNAIIEDLRAVELFKQSNLVIPPAQTIKITPQFIASLPKPNPGLNLERAQRLIAETAAQQDWAAQESLLSFFINLSPNDIELHLRLIDLYFYLNRLDDTWLQLGKALEIAPKSPVLLLRVGMVFYKRGEIAKAESTFKAVLALDKSNTEVMVNLGKLYYDEGKYQKAFALLEAALQKDPDDQEALQGLSMVRKKLAGLG